MAKIDTTNWTEQDFQEFSDAVKKGVERGIESGKKGTDVEEYTALGITYFVMQDLGLYAKNSGGTI